MDMKTTNIYDKVKLTIDYREALQLIQNTDNPLVVYLILSYGTYHGWVGFKEALENYNQVLNVYFEGQKDKYRTLKVTQ